MTEPDSGATFESELARLEEIVEMLAADGVSLDEALRLFEEGVARLRTVTGRLSAAEERIALLSEREDGGFDLDELDG
jgi:exodeoxyribonuclease VII small subunit